MSRIFLLVFLFHIHLVNAQSIKEFGYYNKLPIKPERTISFNTDEGSYMSVDVSPDGKTLVFDLLGDLYSIPITGGKAFQLTEGVALNLRPIWSPDGSKIAYVSDNAGDFTINVLDTKTKSNYILAEKTVSYTKNKVWWPDGNFVAFDKSIYGLAGGELPRVSRGRFSSLISFREKGGK